MNDNHNGALVQNNTAVNTAVAVTTFDDLVRAANTSHKVDYFNVKSRTQAVTLFLKSRMVYTLQKLLTLIMFSKLDKCRLKH